MKNKLFSMRIPATILSVVLLASVFSGCSSNESKPRAFQMVFCGTLLDSDAVESYGKTAAAELPELTIDGKEPVFTSVLMGETQGDPMAGAAGTMKFSAMIAGKEVDVVVSDMENAERNARSDLFVPLKDIFTEEELAALEGKLLSFDQVEMEGDTAVKTGEKTAVCGIDITGNEAMKAIFGDQQIGVFLAANAVNALQGKQLMQSLSGSDVK